MHSQEISIILTILVSSVISLGLLLVIIIFISKHKEKIRDTQIELENIKSNFQNVIQLTQLEIQEETFKKISREIHDNINLGLTLTKLQLTNMLTNKQYNYTELENSIDTISKSLVDLNDISKSLDAKQMIAHGLLNALESEMTVLRKSGIYNATMEIVGSPIYFDAETDLILFRIFQEACNNIIKHARANRIDVDLIYQPHQFLMKITDNGRGFDVELIKNKNEIRKMSGLKNFENRAKLINAEVSIISFPLKGTTINVTIPFKHIQHEKRSD